jgi:hypothetical protein
MADQALQMCLSLTRRITEVAPAARHNTANVAQARGTELLRKRAFPGPLRRSRPALGRSGILIASAAHQAARHRLALADARSDH